MENRILWSNDRTDYLQTLNDLAQSDVVELDNDKGQVDDSMVDELIEMDLNDLLENLTVQLSNSIMLIADIGRWDGRVTGTKLVESGNIADAVRETLATSDYDGLSVEIKDTDLVVIGHHHDGTTVIRIREMRSSNFIEKLEEAVYAKEDIEKAVVRYTRSLAQDVLTAMEGLV